MRRYALQLAYDGRRYAGWQRQPNAPTIAGVVEQALSRLLQTPIKLVGAGRTDAGVHARSQIAHLDFPEPLPLPFLKRLNALLPEDIRALALYESDPTFHARHSALRRTYRYFILPYPDPFQRAYSWYLPWPLCFDKLQEIASHLVGLHNFTGFAKKIDPSKSGLCEVFFASWKREESGIYVFTITANRFLHAMVRALVGAQVRLATGKLTWEKFYAALHRQQRSWGMYLAPPQGLFLWEISYAPGLLSLIESYEPLLASTSGSPSAPNSAPEPPPDPTGAPSGSAHRGA
ncbi:MAG: tRNA pseudouridine(38-40) synthase TruA [Bacteroidia bacterium]|nr:tRNA pseudouridine(38-40) synthase TruA [Bacteroidia bacterium]MDW8089615.1 tRNA pseudouridine(38-40) synthase TruA [Bacteroidia bacterium]